MTLPRAQSFPKNPRRVFRAGAALAAAILLAGPVLADDPPTAVPPVAGAPSAVPPSRNEPPGSALPASAEPADAQPREQPAGAPPRYRMPSILPNEYIRAATDSIRTLTRSLSPRAQDRAALVEGVRSGLRQRERFLERVTQIYPKNQLEWLLITDYAADTLVTDLSRLLTRYAAANPEEILTEGRQLLELELMNLRPTPDRMLGFHVVMLTQLVISLGDSLLLEGKTSDRAGVEDGILRWVQDWTQLYEQAHLDVTQKHASHLKHEDWVLVRLEDNCRNAGADVWQVTGFFMARVGVDSTRTPPLEQFAHEYHLVSRKCPGDDRYVYYDLPYLQDTLVELGRQARVRDEEIQEEMRREKEAKRGR